MISYIHDSYHVKNHWLNKYNWYKKIKIFYIHHLDNKNYGIILIFLIVFGTFSENIVTKKIYLIIYQLHVKIELNYLIF